MSSLRPQNPTSAFYKLLDQIVSNERNTKKSFDDAVNLARGQGFTDTEIAMFMQDYLKGKVPARTLYRWIKGLLPTEDSSSGSLPPAENDGNKDTDNSDNGESGEDNDEEPQTPSGQEALAKSNEFYPPDSIDIKNHPVVQRLQRDLEIERQEKTEWKGKFEQLGEVEKKRAFVTAKDEMNHISGQSTIIMLIMELQKRRNEWKKVKYLVEVVT